MKRHIKEITSGKIKISLEHYQDNNDFIKYCGYKADKIVELCNEAISQFNNIGSFLNILPGEELDYIETNQLKSKIDDFSLSFDQIEKEWLDALSKMPPDNLRALHRSLVNNYETFYEALTEFTNNLSTLVNSPTIYFSETDKSQLDEKEPTAILTFQLTDKYTKVFAEEVNKAIAQNNSFHTLYQSVLSIFKK